MSGGLDKGEVVGCLAVDAALGGLGVSYRRSGTQYRIWVCPLCGPHGHDSIVVSAASGAWQCKVCGGRGDKLALVAGLAGLDIKAEFPRVVALAADLAGVGQMSGVERDRLRQRVELRGQEVERRLLARREGAIRAAPGVWQRLSRESEAGLTYLRGRGLGAAAGEVRYGRHSVCLPLWWEGAIVNVVGRRWDGGEPRVRGLDGGPTLGSFGPGLGDGDGFVVVVEGWADYLSARVLWPSRVVLGAHGCVRIPDVAQLAAVIAKRLGQGVLFVPHPDQAGHTGANDGIAQVMRAGVSEEDIEVYEPGDGDLNNELCAAVH